MILALDMATKKTGWALFNYAGGLIDYGVFRTESSETKERMKEIYHMVSSKILEYPEIVTIVFEDVPLNNHNNLNHRININILQHTPQYIHHQTGYKYH